MIRLRTWFFLGLLFAGACAAGLWTLLHRQPVSLPLQDRIGWMSSATPSVGFVMDPGRPLEYSVPGKVEHIRLLINANLKADVLQEGLSEGNPRKLRPFRVELEERSFWGRTVRKQAWQFLAQATSYRDPETDKLRSTMFYVDRDWVPSNTCEVRLEDLGSRHVSSLRLRLLEADPGIFDLTVRAYSPTTSTGTHLTHGWDRLADPVRAQLLAGNVYPEGLLRTEEKQNILSRTWEPLAPNSPWGRSPLQREIYQVLAAMRPEAGVTYQPQGVRIDPTRLGVIHLPMSGGRFHLKATAWKPGQEGPSAPFLRLHWVGPGLGNQTSRSLSWKDTELDAETTFPGGFLIVETNRTGSIRVWKRDPGGETEITPPPDVLGTTLLRPGAAVAFSVPPSSGAPVAFRLDVRQILTTPDPRTVRTWRYRDQISARWTQLRTAASHVWFEVRDAQGRQLQRGRLPVDGWLSPLEELPEAFSTSRSSLPTSTALLLPLSAREVRVSLEQDPHRPPPPSVLVSGYGRPQALPHVRNLPEDFFIYDTRDSRLPEWFIQEPLDQDRLVREKRWIILRTQYLPDAQEEGLLAGPYELDAFEPLDPPLAREILVPRKQAGLNPREEGLPSYFRELIPGEAARIQLLARPGIRSLRPSLLRIGPGGSAPVSLDWSGRSMSLPAQGAVQETPLPPLPPGEHPVQIHATAPGRYFLNHLWPSPTDWTKRLGYTWHPGQTMTFRHARAGNQPETLTLGYIAEGGAGCEAVIRLKLVGQGPSTGFLLPSLTRTERRFRVRLGKDPQALLLTGAGTSLGVFPLVSLPLGPDLPAGTYHLECTLESGPAGFLTLSRSQAGMRPKSLVEQETMIGARP